MGNENRELIVLCASLHFLLPYCPTSDASDNHHLPPARDRSRVSAAQAPGSCAVARVPVRHGARLLSRGDRDRVHGGGACSTSIRSGSCAAAAARAACSRTVRQRPALRRVVVPERRRIARVVQCRRWAAAARSSPSWPHADAARSPAGRLPCRGGEEFLRPVRAARLRGRRAAPPARRAHARLGRQPALHRRRCERRRRLSELLSHLYVLIPVLDDQKHYWVGDDEVEKLLRAAKAGSPRHPGATRSCARYLEHQRGLVRDAIARLTTEEQTRGGSWTRRSKDERGSARSSGRSASTSSGSTPCSTRSRRPARARVIDLGCGEGKLLRRLLDDRQFEEIVGMDVSSARSRSRRIGCSSIGCHERSASASGCCTAR